MSLSKPSKHDAAKVDLLGRVHDAVLPIPALLRRHQLRHVLVTVVWPILEDGKLLRELRVDALRRQEAVKHGLHDAASCLRRLDATPAVVPLLGF